MAKKDDPNDSVFRIRLGVFFIFLWWIPIWLLAPGISDLLGYGNDPTASHRIFVALIVIQTIIGILGFFVAGRVAVTQMKQVPFKKMPGTIGRILWSGKMTSPDKPAKA